MKQQPVLKFAIVTENYDAVRPEPFISQARRLQHFKVAAHSAAELVRNGAYVHPVFGLRFKAFSIYDAHLYEVAYVTERGEVYYDDITNGLGQFTGALHYILRAAMNAVEEVKRHHEQKPENRGGERARVVIELKDRRWEVSCFIFNDRTKQWEYRTGDRFITENAARDFALSWANYSATKGRTVEMVE